jgi:hypothetical protein
MFWLLLKMDQINTKMDYMNKEEFEKNVDPVVIVNKADFDLLKRHLKSECERFKTNQADNIDRCLCYHYAEIGGYLERLEAGNVLVIA